MPDIEKNDIPEAATPYLSSPRLTAITIENFKGIGAPVTVPLRPITLLFGANSAGKSTVIQALQYAWEILTNRKADVDRTRLGGEVIDLGGFRNIVHGHQLDRVIRIGFTILGDITAYSGTHFLPARGEVRSPRYGADLEPEDTDISLFYTPKSARLDLSVGWSTFLDRPEILGYQVSLDEIPFARIARQEGDAPKIAVNDLHPFFSEEAIRGYAFMEEVVEATWYGHRGDYDIPGIDGDVQTVSEPSAYAGGGWTENAGSGLLAASVIPLWNDPIQIAPGSAPSDYREMLVRVESLLTQLVTTPGLAVLDTLNGLRYLGPLRIVPERNHAAPIFSSREQWANGLGAWNALMRNHTLGGDGPSLVDRCSEYLHETLGLPYTLRREDRIQVPAGGELFSQLRLMSTRFADCEEDDLRRVVLEMENLERIPTIQLHDENNDVDVGPMDIGVGVSQSLPVVVGAVEPNCTIFAVEQPELHIHPAVQVNLADVFLREILEEGKRPRIFLLETHSEHLVLRVMRRMRETCEDKLPAGFPRVTPEDVAVLYVEVVDGRTCVREMPLNERGELVKAWPGGFFEEGLRETL